MPAPATRRDALRRAAGHTCLSCRRPWALRAKVETVDRVVAGRVQRYIAWVVRCRFCDHARTVLTVEDPTAAAS